MVELSENILILCFKYHVLKMSSQKTISKYVKKCNLILLQSKSAIDSTAININFFKILRKKRIKKTHQKSFKIRQICVNTTGPVSTTMVHMFVTVQMVGKDSIVKMVKTPGFYI